MEYIVSGRQNYKYTDLFERAMADGPFTGISSAVAYATVGGVKLLERTLRQGLGDAWNGMQKQWLVGIDWCRSDPPALDRLASLGNSEIKVPNGEAVVTARGCTPTQTFHPKVFILTGRTRTVVICGSGNLSRNGLERGCEIGGVITFDAHDGGAQGAAANADILLRWFRTEWQQARFYGAIAERYEAACRERVRTQAIVPTDDDTKPPSDEGGGRGRALTEEQIHQLRTYKNFWIDGGSLGGNYGKGRPGNQLDMKRFTRAFFGYELENLTPETDIDRLRLFWNGVLYDNCTLKYGDNKMDKLNVPPAGDRGPLFYQNKTLLLTRRLDGDFDFDAGDAAHRAMATIEPDPGRCEPSIR